MKTAIILNPKSGAKIQGELSKLKNKLTAAFSKATFFETTAETHSATNLTRQALQQGFERIIAVGGDGTVNETVNGFFVGRQIVNPQAIFSFVMCGRGNDFRRTFKVPDGIDGAIERAATGQVRFIDVGHLQFTCHDGRQAERIFVNVASFGMSGEVDEKVNQSPLAGILGGSGVFYLSLLQTVVGYRSRQVTIEIDDTICQTLPINTVAVANGRYFGGGMKIAPDAEIDDGFFDIVISGDLSAIEIILQSPSLYRGDHIKDKKVKVIRGKKLTASSPERVLLDVDGETPGRLPATFTILPAALRIQI